MNDEWQYQIRVYLAGDAAGIARRDPGNQVLGPLTGILATVGNIETLTNKTLAAPKLSGLGDYADDAAAAGGGVPVGGVYRTGSALKIRVS